MTHLFSAIDFRGPAGTPALPGRPASGLAAYGGTATRSAAPSYGRRAMPPVLDGLAQYRRRSPGVDESWPGECQADPLKQAYAAPAALTLVPALRDPRTLDQEIRTAFDWLKLGRQLDRKAGRPLRTGFLVLGEMHGGAPAQAATSSAARHAPGGTDFYIERNQAGLEFFLDRIATEKLGGASRRRREAYWNHAFAQAAGSSANTRYVDRLNDLETARFAEIASRHGRGHIRAMDEDRSDAFRRYGAFNKTAVVDVREAAMLGKLEEAEAPYAVVLVGAAHARPMADRLRCSGHTVQDILCVARQSLHDLDVAEILRAASGGNPETSRVFVVPDVDRFEAYGVFD